MTRDIQRGFTLIEIVLVVALIAMVSAAGLRLPYLFAPDRSYAADVFTVVTAAYRAQTLAATGRHDSSWGVYIDDDAVTVFSGDSYTTRDVSFDETASLEAGTAADGPSEIIFARGSALSDDPATLSLRFGERTAAVTLNAYGVIDFTDAQ